MAKARKLKYGCDNMAVSSFVFEGVRVFSNATTLGDETLYSWEIVNSRTQEVVFKQPFTANPLFAYSLEKFGNMDVVARIKKGVELSCKVFEAEQKPLPEIKIMYARRSNFFRYTNTTDIENVFFGWKVQIKVGGHWNDVYTVESNEVKNLEYAFEQGSDYRVTAWLKSADGGYRERLVAELTADDLELPKVI